MQKMDKIGSKVNKPIEEGAMQKEDQHGLHNIYLNFQKLSSKSPQKVCEVT